MQLKTTYTPYHPSLLKSCIYNVSTLFLLCEKPSMPVCWALPMRVFWELPMIGYSAHNLYEQYQHNNKLIKTVELKLEGEKEARTVDMKPNFVDSFTVYNVSGLSASIFDLANEFATEKQPVLTTLTNISSLVCFVSKAIHFFSSDKAKYTFTDENTGESISIEEIIAAEVIGLEF